MDTDKDNTHQDKKGNAPLSPDMEALLTRIRQRREQIQQREGILSNSAELIREDRDR